MTPEHEKIAESFISELKSNGGRPINWRDFANEGATKQIMNTIVSALKEPEWDLVKEASPGTTMTLLTKKGYEFESFDTYRQNKNKEVTTKSIIETLTIKQLKGDIFQLKYWWLLILINIAVTIAIAWLTKGWK